MKAFTGETTSSPPMQKGIKKAFTGETTSCVQVSHAGLAKCSRQQQGIFCKRSVERWTLMDN